MTDTLAQGDQGQQQGETPENANLRHLRERAEAATAAEARAATAERRLAMIEAGIDTSTPLGAYFVESFTGDPTDSEALLTQAQALGVPLRGQQAAQGAQEGAEGDQGQQGIDTGQQGQQTPAREIVEPGFADQRRALATGESNPGDFQNDPREVALANAEDAIQRGARSDEAAGSFVAELVGAAKRGDERVMVRKGLVTDNKGATRQGWVWDPMVGRPAPIVGGPIGGGTGAPQR